ncbi:phospholipid scramblase 3 isoform X1 [Pangasianodon hypophthalmus]|uniref:phospholipid scramblase 3 isoform X1 n=1 Tax=Pangasianodon hypophthalmus TaxID=310915 RepID=UPI00230714AB|nr:phospholipid scramblase 3 isoform X1 [Pangasianodon hypophthalmus]
MSTITAQPLPYGLEREKHIEMLFRAFHQRWRSSTDPQDLATTPAPTQGPVSGDLSPTFQAASLETNRHKGEQWVTETLPAGLAALRTVSQIHITAVPELQGPQCISRRTYSVAAETRQLFLAVEESSCVCMQCCGPARACFLQAFDQDRQKIFLFERPLRADMCCLGCCLMEMKAYTAQRELIGTVHQRWSMFTPYFEVCDSADSPFLRIQGSCCPIRCLSDQEFQVVSMIGDRIGTVWKKWPGYNESCNMDHEHFGLDVSQNINVNTKVLLLAGTFLLVSFLNSNLNQIYLNKFQYSVRTLNIIFYFPRIICFLK